MYNRTDIIYTESEVYMAVKMLFYVNYITCNHCYVLTIVTAACNKLNTGLEDNQLCSAGTWSSAVSHIG